MTTWAQPCCAEALLTAPRKSWGPVPAVPSAEDKGKMATQENSKQSTKRKPLRGLSVRSTNSPGRVGQTQLWLFQSCCQLATVGHGGCGEQLTQACDRGASPALVSGQGHSRE